MQIGMHEAKSQLSKLVSFAQNGEEIFITNRGEIVAKLVAAGKAKSNKAKDIMGKMRALNKKNKLGTLNELMEWKASGRK